MLALGADGVDQIEASFLDGFEQQRNVFGLILQVGVHSPYHVAGRVAKTSLEAAGLTRSFRILNRLEPRMFLDQVFEHLQAAVGGMIVTGDMLPLSAGFE